MRTLKSICEPGRRLAAVCLLLAVLAIYSGPCFAQDAAPSDQPGSSGSWDIDEWFVFTSIYTKHFDPSPDHVNNQKMLGLELRMQNNWVFGFAHFDNSFGQPSQYLYGGYKWSLFDSRYWYFKFTGGLLHGYKEPYEDKISLNGLGIAPAIVPTLGFQWKHLVVEGNLGGLAVFTVTAGIAF